MFHFRGLSWVAVGAFTVACGGDDSAGTGAGGSAGASGSGGAAGSAGASTGGTAGTGGSAGASTGGTAGASTGGTAGAGTGGTAGASTGGTAGAGTGGTAGAGTGGAAGAGTGGTATGGAAGAGTGGTATGGTAGAGTGGTGGTGTDACTPSPCQNGGTCSLTSGGYSCSCAGGYTGTNCETPPAQPLYCDVVYRFYSGGTEYGRFHNIKTGTGARNQQEVVGLNGGSSAQSGPFNTTGSWPGGFLRLRFNADTAGTAPAAGPVSIIEYYMPVEFAVSTFGTDVTTDVDHSAGLLGTTTSGCPSGVTGCLPSNANLALSRQCQPVATGTVTGTTITWGTCGLAPPSAYTSGTGTPSAAQLGWTNAMSQTDTAANPGCLANLASVGNVTCTGTLCTFVPGGTLGVQNNTWDQKLSSFTFGATSYGTTTVTMPEFIIPDGLNDVYSGISSTTSASASHVECGTLAQLTCNEN